MAERHHNIINLLRHCGHGLAIYFLTKILRYLAVYKAIVNKPIASVEASLRRFSPQARSLIVGLLERKVDCRIGYGERDVITFKQHPFFADIDWDLLLMKGIPVDYTPPRAPKGQEDEALADHYSRKNQEVTALMHCMTVHSIRVSAAQAFVALFWRCY